MSKIDIPIGGTYTYGENQLIVTEPDNKISKCSGCFFNQPETNSLHSECYAPDGIRCSFPDRIFKLKTDK